MRGNKHISISHTCWQIMLIHARSHLQSSSKTCYCVGLQTATSQNEITTPWHGQMDMPFDDELLFLMQLHSTIMLQISWTHCTQSAHSFDHRANHRLLSLLLRITNGGVGQRGSWKMEDAQEWQLKVQSLKSHPCLRWMGREPLLRYEACNCRIKLMVKTGQDQLGIPEVVDG